MSDELDNIYNESRSADPAPDELGDIYNEVKRPESPKAEGAALKKVARGLGLGLRTDVEALLTVPAMAGNAVAVPLNLGIKGANALTGSKIPEFPEQGQAVSNALTSLGVPTPATTGERLINDIGRGAVSSLSSFGTGALLSQAAPALSAAMQTAPKLQAISGAASGLSSGAAREVGFGPLGQFVAGLAGGAAPIAAHAGYNTLTGKLANKNDFASSKLNEALTQDNISPQDAAAQLQEMGPHATIADLGPNTRGLARGAYMIPGSGKEGIETFLEQRAAGRADRVRDTLAQGMGIEPGQSYSQLVNNLDQQRIEAADPHYKEAFAANKNMTSPEINAILDTPAGQSALNKAVKTMQQLRSHVGVPDADLAEQAALTGTEIPKGGVASGLKLKTLDLVKQHLYDLEQSAKENGVSTTESNAIKETRKALTKELDKLDVTAKAGPNSLHPEGGRYAQGRAAWSGPSQSREMLDAGRNFDKASPEEIEDLLKNAQPGDKKYYQIGLSQRLSDMIDNVSENRNPLNSIWAKPRLQKAISKAFPDEEAFKQFSKQMTNEKTFSETENAILRNSNTTNKAFEANNLMKPAQGPVNRLVEAGMSHGPALIQRNVIGKGMYLAKGLLNKLAEGKAPAEEDVARIAASTINPSANQAALAKAAMPADTRNLLERYVDYLSSSAPLSK